MKHVNLMPAVRREALRRRRRVRGWTTALAAWTAGLFVLLVLLHATGRGGRSQAEAELADLEGRIERTRGAVGLAAADVATLHSQLGATRAIGRQPDWALLLALLADTLGEDVVLDSILLESPPDAAPAIEVTGLGRSQAAVSRFILRLERQEGLFSRVKLVDTRREPFRTESAFAFRITGTLSAEAVGEATP